MVSGTQGLAAKTGARVKDQTGRRAMSSASARSNWSPISHCPFTAQLAVTQWGFEQKDLTRARQVAASLLAFLRWGRCPKPRFVSGNGAPNGNRTALAGGSAADPGLLNKRDPCQSPEALHVPAESQIWRDPQASLPTPSSNCAEEIRK